MHIARISERLRGKILSILVTTADQISPRQLYPFILKRPTRNTRWCPPLPLFACMYVLRLHPKICASITIDVRAVGDVMVRQEEG